MRKRFLQDFDRIRKLKGITSNQQWYVRDVLAAMLMLERRSYRHGCFQIVVSAGYFGFIKDDHFDQNMELYT